MIHAPKVFALCSVLLFSTGCPRYVSTPSPDSDAQTSSPEERLIQHIEHGSEILATHMNETTLGVRALHAYMQEHLPAILSAVGEITVALDREPDPEKRVQRLNTVLETLHDPAVKFGERAAAFAEKASADENTRRYLEDHLGTWKASIELITTSPSLPAFLFTIF